MDRRWSAAWLHDLKVPLALDIGVEASRTSPILTGVSIYRRLLLPSEITRIAGIPTTTLARTIFDLSAILTADRVSEVVDEVFAR